LHSSSEDEALEVIDNSAQQAANEEDDAGAKK
jgi:hypothetical protein